MQYFISYNYKRSFDGGRPDITGMFNTIIKSDRIIHTREDIKEIQKLICTMFLYDEVTIISYQLMDRPNYDTSPKFEIVL